MIDATIMLQVKQALAEDIGEGDVTAALLPKTLAVSADIIAREPLLLCGQAWVNETFRQLDPSLQLTWHHEEGTWLSEPSSLCHIKGNVRSLLTGERTALNFLQTLSATATQTYRFVQALKSYSTRLLDTRKTLPGWRVAQKYAVRCGGGENHRFGLYDAFLIKENHIKACGSITQAIECARKLRADLFLEIEVETLQELQEALRAKPDRILLDNFTLQMLEEAVILNQPKVCPLEASGGVSLATISSIAETGVDFISVGQVTKSIHAIDLSLLIRDHVLK